MNYHDINQRKTRLRFSAASATLVFVAAICAIVLVFQTSRVLDQRAEAIAVVRTETANLATSLTQHASLSLRATAVVLAGLAERLQSQDSVQGDGETRLERRLRDELALLPQIAEFSIADQSGQIVIDSENDQLGISITDRKYFWYHTEKDSRELFIDAPILGRAPQRWIIPVSRRYNNADGGFAGVATVFLELNFFQKFYEQFDIGHDGAILLMSGDAKLLARRPFVEANIGRDMSQSNIAKALQYASFDCQSALDWDPLSASKRDPFERRVRPVALAPSELAGVAETVRARVV